MQPLGVSRRCIDVLAPSVPKQARLGVLVSFGTVQWSPMTLPLSPRMTTPAGKCRNVLRTQVFALAHPLRHRYRIGWQGPPEVIKFNVP